MIHIEILYIVFGAISGIFASAVVLTGLIFPSIMLSKYHPFSNIIFIISLCDMIAGIGYSLGYPLDGTIACTTQGFISLFFQSGSWIWTSALVYQLRCMIIFKKLFIKRYQLHFICWSISMLVALLPLTMVSYGQDDDLSGDTSCFLKGSNSYYWVLSCFLSVLLVSIIIMILCLISIWYYIKSLNNQDNHQKEKALFQSLYLYPLSLISLWILNLIITWIIFMGDSVNLTVIEISDIIACQYGTMCAIIFFTSSKLVRQKWYELFFKPNINISKDSAIDNNHLFRESFISDMLDIEEHAISSKINDMIPINHFNETLNYEITDTTNNIIHNNIS